MSRTTIMDKARELGRELAASPEYAAMKQAEANIVQDPQARGLIQNFQDLKKACERVQAQGIEPTEAQLQELHEAQTRMLLNPAVRDFTQANERFLTVLQEVNRKIWEGIQGCSCEEEGCGSS